ncbi:hypothetical protein Tco_0871459 [Tanacetum coccineum]
MIKILQNIDREDLETLWKLVKAKHGNTRPEEAYERVLWGNLKVMFEPDVESDVWRNLQGHKVTTWKLFSSSGVHFVRFQNLHIFMLVEKKYSLIPATITTMLNKKLQTDHWNEMCYQLLKLMTKQVKNPGKDEHQVQGRIVGIKRLHDDLRVNTAKNQAVIWDGRIDIQSKNVSYAENECSASSTKEQMLLAIKDEAGGNLNEEENEFMLDNAYGDDTLEELSAVVIIMARIQPADDNADAEVISEVNALQINLISGMLSKGVHEHMNPEKLETAINTSDDDQIDSNIIFNNPYVENNDGTYEHDSKAHD